MTIRDRLSGRSRGQRFTVQLSSDIVRQVEARAAAEGSTMAAIARRAIIVYLMELNEEMSGGRKMKPLNIDEFEEGLRRGRRGPQTQWPERVYYVLPEHIAGDLQETAVAADRSVAELAREAVIRHVKWALPEVPKRAEVERDGHGFARPRPNATRAADVPGPSARSRTKASDTQGSARPRRKK